MLYAEADRVFTSAGSAAGLDLCLHLVRRDFGSRVANEVGRRLVLPPHREGGQAQFIDRPVADREDARFARLFDWIRARLPERISVDRMAAEARSEEHTSELQSLMRSSYAVFCLKKNKKTT